MKTIFIFLVTVLASVSIISCKVETKTEPVKKTGISEFIGQWTIDIQGGSVGWLEVRQEENYLDADLLWASGSVLPVSNVFLAKNQVLFVTRSNDVVRKRDENKNSVKTQVV